MRAKHRRLLREAFSFRVRKRKLAAAIYSYIQWKSEDKVRGGQYSI